MSSRSTSSSRVPASPLPSPAGSPPPSGSPSRRRFIQKFLLGSAGVVVTGGAAACTTATEPETVTNGSSVSVLDWGARSDFDPSAGGGHDSAAAFQRAIDELFNSETATELHVPSGDYLIAEALDLENKYLRMIGAGMRNTTLYAGEEAGGAVLDVEEEDRTGKAPGLIESLRLDASLKNNRAGGAGADGGASYTELLDDPMSNEGGVGINLVGRHLFEMRSLRVIGFDVGIAAHWTWLCRWQNVLFGNNRIGLLLKGWNNRCKLDSLSFQGVDTEVGVYIGQDNPNNENNSILLDTCDFEFMGRKDTGTGIGVVNDSNRTVIMRNCYSEQVGGPVIHAKSGLTRVRGGFYNYNMTVRNPLVHLDGGNVDLENVDLYPHRASPHPVSQLAHGTDGKITIKDCRYSSITGSRAEFDGDIFGYGPGQNYVPSLGRLWNKTNVTGGARATVVENALEVTWNRGGIVSIHAPLDTTYRQGEDLYLLVVYESTFGCNVRLSGGAGSHSPNKRILRIPATEGEVRTVVKLDSNWGTANFTTLEFLSNESQGARFKLYEVTITDARLMRSGGAPDGLPSSLYKITSPAARPPVAANRL